MENLTLGQIAIGISFLVGLISGVGYLSSISRKWLKDAMKEQLDVIAHRLDQVDMESTKNYLVTYLSDIERGKALDEIEKERFYEQYQHYCNLGGNSYIKNKVDQMRGKGWL